MPKHSKYARLDAADKDRILDELARWGRGEIAQKLTWSALEERYGFSRQALSSHEEIKQAKAAAEIALGRLPKDREATAEEVQALRDQIELLNKQIEDYKRREGLWRERWQRIAFHIRQQGMNVHLVDKPAEGDLPNSRETAQILNPFDKDIPPSKAYREDE